MTQPTEGLLSAPDASGVSLAYKTVGSFKQQIVMQAGVEGHLRQTLPSYLFFSKGVTYATTAAPWFDIFNATGSGKLLKLLGLWGYPQLQTAVAPATPISPDLDFVRTSAVGSGGVTASYKGAAATTGTIYPHNTTDAALPAQVTARTGTPALTVAEILFSTYSTQATIQAGAQLEQWYNMMPLSRVGQRYIAQEGQGFGLRLNANANAVSQSGMFLLMFGLV